MEVLEIRREKVVVIPVSLDGLWGVVKDRQSGDFTLITGGKKKSDRTFENSAMREFYEETDGSYKGWSKLVPVCEFTTTYRPPELAQRDRGTVVSLYKVFRLDLKSPSCHLYQGKLSNPESSELRFVKKEDLGSLSWWSFMETQVLPRVLKV